MKNLICPISNEKVPKHHPRLVAFFVVSLLIAYIVSGVVSLLIFLAFDFFMRSMNKPKLSVVNHLAVAISKRLKIKSELIDKAPKIFAARLGLIMLLVAIVIHILGGAPIAVSIAAIVIVLSALECVLGLCLGCYVYSWIVLPIVLKK